jgi:DNA-binding Xre family transcriptional regulator
MWIKIEKVLKEKELSINELSKKIYGQKRNMTIYALRDGKIKKPSFDLICKIADALEMDLNYFRD